MKLKEVFDRKQISWSAEKDYHVNQGKADHGTLSKAFFMVPLAFVIACLSVMVAVFGVSTIKSGVTSVMHTIFMEEELRPAAAEMLFSDVKADSKFFDALVYLKKNGVISGFDDNTFRPYQELKRAELIKTIVNAKNFFPLALNYNGCFRDVQNQWHAPSICFAKEKNWINGYADGTFHPEDSLTRAEALKIIMEAFEVKTDSEQNDLTVTFADLDRDAWYFPYIQTALRMGLIEDNPSLELYKPEGPALRGETAQVIYRVLLNQN